MTIEQPITMDGRLIPVDKPVADTIPIKPDRPSTVKKVEVFLPFSPSPHIDRADFDLKQLGRVLTGQEVIESHSTQYHSIATMVPTIPQTIQRKNAGDQPKESPIACGARSGFLLGWINNFEP
jgi:hypothetical protein